MLTFFLLLLFELIIESAKIKAIFRIESMTDFGTFKGQSKMRFPFSLHKILEKKAESSEKFD